MRRRWELYHYSGSPSSAFAFRTNRSAVEGNEVAHDRKPEAETTLGAIHRLGPLHEMIEHALEHLGLDPLTLITHRDDDAVTGTSGRQLHLLPLAAVLGGVVQQIVEYLHEARRISLDNQPARRNVDLQSLAPVLKNRLGNLDRLRDHGRQLDPSHVQLHVASSNAGDVEQIVDQAAQM